MSKEIRILVNENNRIVIIGKGIGFWYTNSMKNPGLKHIFYSTMSNFHAGGYLGFTSAKFNSVEDCLNRLVNENN